MGASSFSIAQLIGQDIVSQSLTANGGTVTASAPPIAVTQTWNNAGVTFTAQKINITDTLSATDSAFIDCQLGGTQRLLLGKSVYNTNYATVHNPNNGLNLGKTNTILMIGASQAGNSHAMVSQALWQMRSGMSFGWSSASGDVTASSTLDTILARDAANTLAQRNAANAQVQRIYSTYTDASNYERLAQNTSIGAYVEVAAESAGTGGANLDVRLTPKGTGGVNLPGGALFLKTRAAITNGAGAGAGTITNAPAAGNPTCWIPISDNGTTRYIPAW